MRFVKYFVLLCLLYAFPVMAQIYDLPCAPGSSPAPQVMQTVVPQTGHLRANTCVDGNGVMTINASAPAFFGGTFISLANPKYGLKADVKVAVAATWSNSSSQITTGSTDPVFLSTDVGKQIWGTTNCSTTNGEQNCNTLAIPQGTITSVLSAHVVNISTTTTAANQAPTGGGFTGWVLWHSDDTAAVSAAVADWIAASSTANSTLVLPCSMFATNTGFTRVSGFKLGFNVHVIGCPGSTVVVSPPSFNYAGCPSGCFFYDAGVNAQTGISTDQSPYSFDYIRDFTIWGGGNPGLSGITAPAVYCNTCFMDDVAIVAWNWKANNTLNTIPAVIMNGGQWKNCYIWTAGNYGMRVLGLSPNQLTTNLMLGGYVTEITGRGVFVVGPGTWFTTQNVQFSSSGGSDAGAAFVMNDASGIWSSYGDFGGEMHVDAGIANVHGSRDNFLGSFGWFVAAGATLSITNSQVSSMNISGTWRDEGGNFGQYLASANNAIVSTGNYIAPRAVTGACTGTVPASSTIGLYGTGANITTTACAATVGNGVVMDHAGTAYALIVSATTGGVNASSGAVSILKNGVSQTTTCTLGTTTFCADLAHSFNYAKGDIITVQLTTQAADTLAGPKLQISTY